MELLVTLRHNISYPSNVQTSIKRLKFVPGMNASNFTTSIYTPRIREYVSQLYYVFNSVYEWLKFDSANGGTILYTTTWYNIMLYNTI